MNLEEMYDDIFGKRVSVTDDEGNVFTGFLSMFENTDDSDDGIPSITLEGTKQFPYNLLELKENEIKSIEVLDD